MRIQKGDKGTTDKFEACQINIIPYSKQYEVFNSHKQREILLSCQARLKVFLQVLFFHIYSISWFNPSTHCGRTDPQKNLYCSSHRSPSKSLLTVPASQLKIKRNITYPVLSLTLNQTCLSRRNAAFVIISTSQKNSLFQTCFYIWGSFIVSLISFIYDLIVALHSLFLSFYLLLCSLN